MKAARLFDLSGRLAVVTGASRGIGAAVAHALAANGAEVVVTSRRIESCQTVASEIGAAGGRAHARACHIGDLASIEALFAWLDATFPRLDVLVNNAATNPLYGPVVEVDPAGYQKTMDVNVRGTWFMTRAAAERMGRAGCGSIVNIASVAAEQPIVDIGLYSTTKAAVVNLTRAFARECGARGVRVNAVLPGLVNTKLAAALQAPEVRARVLPAIPLGRIAEPADIVGAILYFASDASAFATGSELRVDGGWRA